MKDRPHIIPCIIAVVFLVGAFGKWPIGYYTFLRFVVCCTAAYVAYISFISDRIWGVWLFGGMAALFNPIIKIYLGKELWQVVDVIAIGLYIVGILAVKKTFESKIQKNQ